jgi:arabinogalactan endo-1,4-beta-galactosidase
MRRSPRHWRLGVGIAALVLITPLVTAAASSSPSPAAAAAPSAAPTVNWALAGASMATATTTESGYPASNASDAGTDWCTSGWTGTLTVDLGQLRRLGDLGITLDSASPSASASIELAATAGDWQQAPALHDLALDPGSPMYVPLPAGTSARYAELTVFSDTGADVCVGEFRTKQNIPAAWAGEDLSQLTATVNSYTRQVIAAFARQGTPVDLVSIGNEIRNGILWPTGEINCTDCGGWANLAQLLKAGVAGAEAGNPAGHKLLIIIHYDQGGSFALSSAFYSELESYGVPFDMIGLSYYPVLDEPSISGLRANVDGLAAEFGKPIVIAETQYPWTLANGNSPLGDSTGDFGWEQSQIEPGYPATPGGQLSFVTDELSILATAPDGLGAGLFYWAPDWIPGVPWEPGTGIGSPNVNMTLFNFEGQALPSIGIFENPAGVCERANPDSAPCVVGG